MDFAEIRYAKNFDETVYKTFIGKLPRVLYLKYLMLFAPLKIKNVQAFGAEGIEVILPVYKHEEDADLKLRLIKKAAAVFLEKKTEIVINRDKIPMVNGFKEVTGSVAMAFFMKYIINEAARLKGIDLSSAEIVVIDGENLQTYAVINSIKEEVNNLWIHTYQKKRLEAVVDMVYEYSGLLAECFENAESCAMAGGDIIINCRGDMENFDFILKKGAIFIDVSGMSGKFNRLAEERKDMFAFNDCRFKIGNEMTDSYGAEAYFLIKLRAFQRIFERGGKMNDIENIAMILMNDYVKFDSINNISD
ncbi:MAG: hypothetical protein HFE62_05935 [Firmicutes bacterium]|nr:hypothetical protein [Bacillota bacterium]